VNTFPLKILTPAGEVLSADVTHVAVRTETGALGIMAKHTPLLASCPQGPIRIQRDGLWVTYDSTPFVLNMDGTTVTILSASATESDPQSSDGTAVESSDGF